MKIVLDKGSVKGIQFASGVCAHDGLYSHILFVAGERIQVIGTNLEQTNAAILQGSITEKGSIMLPAKKFLAIARAAGDAIEIESDGTAVKIKSGRVRHKLVCMDPESFPTVHIPENGWVPIPAGTLRKVIEAVDFSIATDDSRYVFNGVFLARKNDKLTAVATDGRRLALVSRLVAEASPIPEKGIIVSGGLIREIKKFLSQDGRAFLVVNETSFSVSDPDTGYTTTGRLIDGVFPDYQQVIPKKLTGRCEVSRTELLTVLQNMILSEDIRRVYAIFGENPLVIGCSAADLGESTGELDCKTSGEVHTIGLNAAYLLEAIEGRTSDTIVIEYSGPASPIRITDPSDPDWLSVVMPMT